MTDPHHRYAPSAHAAARKYPMYVLPLEKVLSLDLAALISGASYRGEFESRLKQVFASGITPTAQEE